MLKSIKSTLALINAVTIVLVTALVVDASLNIYERQYAESVSKNMNALVGNLSEDLLQYVGTEPADIFNITAMLLRLDKYENVKFAYLTDNEGKLIQNYIGVASAQEVHRNKVEIPPKLLNSADGIYRANGDITILKK